MTEKKIINLTVDGKDIEAMEGESLLQVCLDNNIYIPNLCHIKDREIPSASCRLCFVEIEGNENPLPSCTQRIRNGMIVKTDTPSVRRLQAAALRLLLSVHNVDCSNCQANKKCELQKLSGFLNIGLKSQGLEKALKKMDIDGTHPLMNYYPNRCVLCGKCVYLCKEKHNKPFLTFARRGLDTVISFFSEEDISKIPCEGCFACIEICPVSAIVLKQKA